MVGLLQIAVINNEESAGGGGDARQQARLFFAALSRRASIERAGETRQGGMSVREFHRGDCIFYAEIVMLMMQAQAAPRQTLEAHEARLAALYRHAVGCLQAGDKVLFSFL